MNLGQKPNSDWLKHQLNDAVCLLFEDCIVIVHHYTDTKDYIQIEAEIRNKITNDIKFIRVVI